MDWEPIGESQACPVGEAMEAVYQGRIVAVYHLESGWYATDGTCPHAGGPLGQGKLDGTTLTCPWHGLCLDVTTGEYHLGSPAMLECFQVKEEDGQLFVAKK